MNSSKGTLNSHLIRSLAGSLTRSLRNLQKLVTDHEQSIQSHE